MSWTNYDLVGSYNNQRVSSIDAERSINLFEYLDSKGKKKQTLLPTSGIFDTGITFNTSGGWRAQFVFLGVQYGVVGTSFIRITGVPGTYVFNTIGTLAGSSTTYVGMDANTFQVIMVNGQFGYIFDIIANTFTQITDTGFPLAPIDVCYLDGFFVVANGGTNNFQLSQFNQGMVWSGSGLVNFTASGDTLTIPTGTANFQTGVDIQLVGGTKTSTTFTADTSTNLITVGSTADYPQGAPVSVKPGTAGVLPAPLSPDLVYWVINVSGTTLKLAATLAKATSGDAIILTNNGTPPNNIISTTSLPAPLKASTTYYVIRTGATTIKLAASLADAQAGTAITLSSTGTPPNQIENNGQLQQGSITSHPGNIVACRTLHRRLFLFSFFYTEVWENAGIGTNLPFRRNNSSLIEYGTPAIGSIQVGFDRMFFLSQDKDGLGAVMKVEGTQAVPVSNRALDFQLAQYAAMPVPMGTPSGVTGVSDARGILIKENGIIFYRLNFTLANHTFVYNDSMSNPMVESERRWHEEEILNGDRHPAQTHAFYNGVNYYGNYLTPTIYQVDPNFSTNDGQPIRRARIGKPFVPETYQRIRIDRFHIDLVQGSIEEVDVIALELDLLTEDGDTLLTENGVNILLENSGGSTFNANPKVFLSFSKDGGQSYGNQLIGPMGKIGDRTFRTVWRKLGTIPRGQSFTPYVQFFNTIPFVILGAAWVYEVLPE